MKVAVFCFDKVKFERVTVVCRLNREVLI